SSDAFTWIFNRAQGNGAYDVLIISNFLVYIMGYEILRLFTRYVTCLTGPGPMANAVYVIAYVGMLLTFINLFTHFMYYIDASNVYHRTTWFVLSQGLGLAGTVCLGIHIFIRRQKLANLRALVLITYIVLPSLAMIIQSFYYGIPLLNIAISAALFLNLTVMLLYQRRRISEQAQELIASERKLLEERERVNDMKIRLVLSQVKPHFLFNALNAIYYLIEKSPMQAQAAIDSFSDYLRGNMEALEHTALIPISQEMKHVKSYLRLEEMRFQDELEVIYDVKALNFDVPALSVEPIVENAVKHGISQNESGGYVKISTDETDAGYEIKVEDNGAGFDVEDIGSDGRLHVGITNVRTRLESMAKGTLTIESEIGKGTRVTIFIPR
ncbi:MAG: histidine kinase, partial [Lachnospiraceae bacterium]|nr:histidine kinase [Lachnospiraceae bacterium]